MTLSIEEKKERSREYNRRYKERHPEKRTKSLKDYNNKPETIARRKKWLSKNKEQYEALKLEWSRNNPGKVKANTDMFKKNNPGYYPSQCAKRRSKKLQATPSWVTSEEQWLIDEAYDLAAVRSNLFGFKWHVDHIIPLQGKNVCGLHVIENLQIIPWLDNIKKHNKWQPQ